MTSLDGQRRTAMGAEPFNRDPTDRSLHPLFKIRSPCEQAPAPASPDIGQAELFAQQIVDAPARPHRKFGESGKTDLWRNGQSGPQVALPITRDDRIDGQADRVESSRLASIYSLKIQLIVLHKLKLDYIWPAEMCGDVP